jgi:non-heme chloroperoxidase
MSFQKTVRSALVLVASIFSSSAVADEVKRIPVNGYEIAYVEAGQGDPIIFVSRRFVRLPNVGDRLPKFRS